MLSLRESNLVWLLAWTDFKLKYKRSVLGFFWSLLKPLLMLATLFVVFSIFLRFDVENYPLFLLFGILLWNFFAESTVSGLESVLQKGNLIKKGNNLKSNAIVAASVLTNFLTLLLNLLVFSVFVVVFGIKISLALLIFPLFLFELFILSLGLCFGLAALNVKHADTRHVWDVLLQIGFWVTPIVYPVSVVPKELLGFYMLNPVARIVSDSRDAVLFGIVPDLGQLLVTFAICISVLLIGYAVFRRIAPSFGEEL